MSEKIQINFKSILKGVLASFIITVILVFIIALTTYFIDISDRLTAILLFGVSVVSTIIGGILLTRHCKQKGLLHGFLLGIFYFLIMLLISYMINMNFSWTVKTLTILISTVCGGMFGGIVGINSKK